MSKPAIDQIIKAVRAKFGAGTALRLSEGAASEVKEVIPTGIELLDRYVLAVGGFPVGRLSEVYGEEACGKTTIALSAAASVQKMGGLVMWAETEEAFNSQRAATLGVDVDSMILLQPETIEEVGQVFEEALKSIPAGVGPVLAVWDSIAATPTAREIEEGLEGSARVGDRAMTLNRICRLLCPLAVEKRVALLFTNQVREKIGVMFGDSTITPGGKAVKFHSSIRLQMFSGKAVKDSNDKEHLGKTVTFLSAKNKMAPPWRKVQVRLDYATGWDNQWATINFAKDRKLIEDKLRYTETTYDLAKKALGWVNASEQKGE